MLLWTWRCTIFSNECFCFLQEDTWEWDCRTARRPRSWPRGLHGGRSLTLRLHTGCPSFQQHGGHGARSEHTPWKVLGRHCRYEKCCLRITSPKKSYSSTSPRSHLWLMWRFKGCVEGSFCTCWPLRVGLFYYPKNKKPVSSSSRKLQIKSLISETEFTIYEYSKT